MFTMEEITTNFVGDWMYSEKKLKVLTKERAVEDIHSMSKSPDYTGDDTDKALNMAAEQLNITRLELIAGLLITDARKVS